MTEEEFRATLPECVDCGQCHRVLDHLQWNLARYGSSDWLGISIVKCEPCSWMKIAAAGSSEKAHKEAQAVRSRLMRFIGK